MINVEELKKAGVDYEVGLVRFMNDVELYEMVLNAFLSDNTYERAKNAFENRNIDALFQAVHEAKGSSGNAGLTTIYNEASALSSLLRSDNYTETELIELYNLFYKEYTKVYNGVKAAMSD